MRDILEITLDALETAERHIFKTDLDYLALVEALESAQRENTDGVAGMAESYETTISMLRSRIAELESRAVTLPDVEKWRPVKEVCGQYSYRALAIKSLAAAGIKCEVKGE